MRKADSTEKLGRSHWEGESRKIQKRVSSLSPRMLFPCSSLCYQWNHFLLILTTALLLSGCKERVKMNPEKSKLDYSLSALQLWTDYKDPKSADEKYLMKIVEVSGIIEKTGTNVIENPYVILQTGDPAGGVQCFFAKKYFKQASELKVGESVKIRGRCIGKVVNVSLDDCLPL